MTTKSMAKSFHIFYYAKTTINLGGKNLSPLTTVRTMGFGSCQKKNSWLYI